MAQKEKKHICVCTSLLMNSFIELMKPQMFCRLFWKEICCYIARLYLSGIDDQTLSGRKDRIRYFNTVSILGLDISFVTSSRDWAQSLICLYIYIYIYIWDVAYFCAKPPACRSFDRRVCFSSPQEDLSRKLGEKSYGCSEAGKYGK